MRILIQFGVVLAYALFLKCYFPSKQFIPGMNTYPNYSVVEVEPCHLKLNSLGNQRHWNKSLVKHLYLVLIDALRVDFVKQDGGSSHMSFVETMLKSGKALGYIAKVHPPTVTLPRIKALSTGSIPAFVDVVMNFGTSALQEDNWISQAKSAGKKIVFYGDDTWLNLFPHHFIRSEGTVSFFVSDYTEVDDNVTRHLPEELRRKDFDVMILHYLGLDHIGHTQGPYGSLIAPKLKEMDNIIHTLHQQMTEGDVMVVCGDHGMSDQGGHGGASLSETQVPMVVLSKHLGEPESGMKPWENIEQIDLAPTLSLLLGLPIPLNNLGRAIPSILHHLDPHGTSLLLRYNVEQIVKVLQRGISDIEQDEGYMKFLQAEKAHCDVVERFKHSDREMRRIENMYFDAMGLMSSRIAKSLTQYDIYGLIVSSLLLWLALLFLVFSFCGISLFLWSSVFSVFISVLGFAHICVCTNSRTPPSVLCKADTAYFVLQGSILFILATCLTAIFSALITVVKSTTCQNVQEKVREMSSNKVSIFFVASLVLHTVSLLSSSFVEEEHQTWYFLSVTVVLVVLALRAKDIYATHFEIYGQFSENISNGKYDDLHSCQCLKQQENNWLELKMKKDLTLLNIDEHCFWYDMKNLVAVLFLCRAARAWNQTGNKWLDTPDIGDWLIGPERKTFLSVTSASALGIIIASCWKSLSWLQRATTAVGLLLIFVYQCSVGNFGVQFLPLDVSRLNSNQLACLTYVTCLLLILVGVFKNLLHPKQANLSIAESIKHAWIILMLLLAKPQNIALTAMIVLQEYFLGSVFMNTKDKMSPRIVTLVYLWMGMAAFFYQGNSNSLSTVDVSAGYVGLQTYSPVPTALLLACSTFGGPVYWLISLYIRLHGCYVDTSQDDYGKSSMVINRQIIETLMITRALPLAVYTVLVTLERYHLFVWTVFSPKLLYEGMFTLVITLYISVLSFCNFFLTFIKQKC